MSDGAKRGQSPPPGNPMAPPVYRPQANPKAAQAKAANGAMIQKPVAPPVYRPQQAPNASQAKAPSVPRFPQPGQGSRQPGAPPVYHPPASKAAQPKAFTPRQPLTAPAVYRPQQQRITQPKMASAWSATIQAVLSFDSKVGRRWEPDKQHCSLCTASTSWRHRHHCRVCGRFVCDACGGQSFSVRYRYTSSGRTATASPSTERVCVDCVLEEKKRLAAGVLEFQTLAADANRVAGRAVAVQWRRTPANAFYDSGSAMITLDPTQADPFSSYIFELTNAAQSNVHLQPEHFPRDSRQGTGRNRRGSFGDAPEGMERYAFHTEFVEYSGTKRHDRVVVAINAAGLGFTAARSYTGVASHADFVSHMARQERPVGAEPSHTGRYREQYRDHWNQQPSGRRGSFS
ncbi:MAG TPA: FYVE zinc finger domain-containing protein [Candidatus Angelobacter sp.]|nr:FYVE zinc finger domain-containing protein [Candidatus Angelobacter sp.]